MPVQRAPAALVPEASPPEKRALEVQPFLDRSRRALNAPNDDLWRGRIAKRLVARRLRRSLGELRACYAQRAAVEQDPGDARAAELLETFESSLPKPWARSVLVVATIVIAELIISVAAATAGTERLVDATVEVDPADPASVLQVVRAILDGRIVATVFLAWTALLAASLVLAVMWPAARRFRAQFHPVLAEERRAFQQVGARAPGPPTVDLWILTAPIAMAFVLGVHLWLMTTEWPVDDGLNGARRVTAVLSWLLASVATALLVRAWRRRLSP